MVKILFIFLLVLSLAAPVVADDTKKETKDLLCYGRGVSIISKFMDKVSYDRNGARIEMIKHFC